MKLRILAEGSTGWQRFIKHWGLSVLIDGDILFDTFGKPDLVLRRLEKTGADIGRLKHIAVSHDDWDHVTGLWRMLDRYKDLTVYICPGFSPEIKRKIKDSGARCVEAASPAKIRDNIFLSGQLEGSRNGMDIPEQYLAVKTPDGVTVITGCAHPGIVEIAIHAREHFGSAPALLIGGFHLMDHKAAEARPVVLKLRSLGVRRVMPTHCTGRAAQRLFKEVFGRDCAIPREGQTIEI